jgi:hypothetical protein
VLNNGNRSLFALILIVKQIHNQKWTKCAGYCIAEPELVLQRAALFWRSRSRKNEATPARHVWDFFKLDDLKLLLLFKSIISLNLHLRKYINYSLETGFNFLNAISVT